ncbi:unnamed protein product [Linum trigynum]|uniref:Elongator complex protein 4 n=1 Tax=Linum trigynum TaxID=586398 RepID=A0AAV2ENR3_9ROSI
MAATKTRTTLKSSAVLMAHFFVSSGIPDLDKTLGGGIPLGSLVMEKGLRIAWQYKKYFGENQSNLDAQRDNKQYFSNEFDLWRPLDRHFYTTQHVDCISTQDLPNLAPLQECCTSFLSHFPSDSNIVCTGRIAIQSLCAPQCENSSMEWEMLSFIIALKTTVRSANAVAIITFPSSLVSPSFCKRWQHLADCLVSVKAIPDEDKELAKLLTGYQDIVGFLNINKVPRINTQVPAVLEATTLSIKLQKRRYLVLECLNQAPIDGSRGRSYGTSGSCSGSPSQNGSLDF